jgi:hypothetical protein
MERICRHATGLFPAPNEISLACSCPDWAAMCKHVAAVLYGIGARLDERPELLFKLREVDEKDLIARAGRGVPLSKSVPRAERLLAGAGLGEIFGLEMAEGEQSPRPPPADGRGKAAEARRKHRPAGPVVMAPGAKPRSDREAALSRPGGKTAKGEPPKRGKKARGPKRGTKAKRLRRTGTG